MQKTIGFLGFTSLKWLIRNKTTIHYLDSNKRNIRSLMVKNIVAKKSKLERK
jgi:hypothetical protein